MHLKSFTICILGILVFASCRSTRTLSTKDNSTAKVNLRAHDDVYVHGACMHTCIHSLWSRT